VAREYTVKKCFALALIALLFYSCGGYPRTSVRAREVSLAVRKAAMASDAPTVYLNQLTDFQWDTVHLYSPYTGYETMSAEVGEQLSRVIGGRHSVPDGHYLLIFLSHSRIVEVVLHSCENGDFERIVGTNGGHAVYTPENAVFEVQGPPHYRYLVEPAPSGP
jgi:hypothetical protein